MQEETQEVNSTGTQEVVLPMDKRRASIEAQSRGGLQSQGKPEPSQHDTLPHARAEGLPLSELSVAEESS